MKNNYPTRVLGLLLALVAFSLAPFGKTHAQCTAEGGAIAFADGTTSKTIIVDDTPDPLEVTLDGNQVGDASAWLITDANGIILGLPDGPPFDLNGAGAGVCSIWYLSYEGKVDGLEVGNNAASITGCLDLSNPLTVDRQDPPAPCTATAESLTPDATPVTLGEDGSATISATVSSPGTVPDDFESIYVLTMGDDLVVQAVSTTPSFTVTMAGGYRIHNLVANTDISTGDDDNELDLSVVAFGTTTAQQVLDLVADNDLCAALDAMGAQVTVEAPTPPTCAAAAATLTPDVTPVALNDGSATISATVAAAGNVPEGFTSVYVLTMGDDLVLQAISSEPSFEVDMAGDYRIHNLVADVGVDVQSGQLNLDDFALGEVTAAQVLAVIDGPGICASLDPDGALVVVTDDDGTTTCEAVAGTLTPVSSPVTLTDGEATVMAMVADPATVPAGYEQLYVLTMGDDLVIQGVSTTPSFTVAMAGTFRIHSLVANTDVSDGDTDDQLDLSVVTFGTTTAQQVLDLVADNDICAALDAMGAMIVVDDGNAGTNGGTVTGLISTPGGLNFVNVCDDDNGSTVTAQLNYDTPVGEVAYVLTDENFVILEIQSSPTFDFSDDAPDKYHIWAFNYTGEITGMPGESVFATQFSTQDWTISQNCIVVIVGSGCEGGQVIMTGDIASQNGGNAVTVCSDDADDDHDDASSVTVEVNYGTPVGQRAYVLTDTAFKILEIQTDPTFDFSDDAPGKYHLWAFNYTGEITANVGDDVFSTMFSDMMWLISRNCIIVTVGKDCDGTPSTGIIATRVSTPDGGNAAAVCTDDDDHDDDDDTVAVDFSLASNTGQVAYVLTDTEFNILEIQDGNTFDFGDRAPGTYHLWAFNYTGDILAMAGDPAFSTRFSDDEFRISQNCIVVTVGDDCTGTTPFNFTAAPVSDDEFVIRRALEEVVAPDTEGTVDIRVTAPTGRLITSADDVPADALDAYRMSTNGAGRGMYFITVVRDDEVITHQVVFQ